MNVIDYYAGSRVTSTLYRRERSSRDNDGHRHVPSALSSRTIIPRRTAQPFTLLFLSPTPFTRRAYSIDLANDDMLVLLVVGKRFAHVEVIISRIENFHQPIRKLI